MPLGPVHPCGGCTSRCGSRTAEAVDAKKSGTVWEPERFALKSLVGWKD